MNNGATDNVSASLLSSTAGYSGIASGRDTPTCIGDSMSIDARATCKDDKKGRHRGAVSIGVQEHVSLLHIVPSNPSSFNASESSPEQRAVHSKMFKSFYLHWGSLPRSSSTLHSHPVEMYGAVKKGMRKISLTPGAPKCPASYLEADGVELEIYVTPLFELLVSDKG
jgi:hypothetical protein